MTERPPRGGAGDAGRRSHLLAGPGVSRMPVETRSYEIDSYGHVNNAVFVQWTEHGRLCWLRDRGLSYTSIPETYGVRVVLVALRLDYRAEVVLGDRLVVATDVVRTGRSSFTFAHRIELEDGRTAAEGEAVMACTRDGRSTPIPEGLRALLAPAGNEA